MLQKRMYTTIQHFTKLYKYVLQHVPNFTTLYKNAHVVYNPYSIVQSLTTLFTHAHNFTTTSHKQTKNSTQLHTTVQHI